MEKIQTPSWVKHAVFYQIFPDRFAKSIRINQPEDGIKFVDWGSAPNEKDFHGGDLYGVIEKLDYLVDLGVNALYLNPIFASTSNHRYNTYDYFKVDPLLGGESAFRELIEKAHKKGIKIILDAVLNHTGRGFWQFNHILENGNKSPYIDWFIVHDWPLRPYSNNEEMPINYEAWWGYPELPKLNTNNSFVQDYLFEMTEYWMDFGIDGWRIDVPMEINAPGFWEKFRKVVKKANPEAYIVGEVWGEAKEWLAGDRFDAVMNYIFANNAINYFGAKTININRFSHDKFKVEAIGSREFGKRIDEMMKLYDWEITQSQLNLLDSHDMPRALWIMGNDKSALKLLVLFQMTMPGAPCVYYGDEVGLSSAGDPHCREAYPWGDRKRIDQDLHSFYKKLISLRNSNSVLRTGTYKTLYSDDDVFAFIREDDQNSVIVLFNSNQKEINVVFDTQNEVIESKLWSINGERLINIGGANKIQVKAREGVVIFFPEKFTKPLKFNILI